MMDNLALVNPLDWKSDFISFIDGRLDEISKDSRMTSLEDISKNLFANRSEIMGRAALAFIEKNHGHLLEQQYCPCPLCQRRIKAMPKKVKRKVRTLIGSVELWRPYFYCKFCGYGFYPLDEALGLSERQVQPDVQEVEAWLTAEMPYETASEAFERCTGMPISDHHMHDVTNEIAGNLDILDVCPTKDEILDQIDQLAEGRFRRPVLMIGIDGAHAPMRPEPSPRKGKRGKGGYQEVKGFRMYLLDGARIIHLISWHQVKNDKELADDLLKIKQAGLIPEDKVRICVIGDGASWIWNRAKKLYPNAKMVLDYYHCSEYLYALANAQYGKENQKGQEWVEAALTKLFCNRIEDVIAEIKQMKPSSDTAAEEITKTARYLSNRTDKVNYGALKRGGYHIGSGGIESSNKFISNVRLKRSGAWWYPTNANNILKLRCAKYNGTFDRAVAMSKNKNKKAGSQKELPGLRLVVGNSSRNR